MAVNRSFLAEGRQIHRKNGLLPVIPAHSATKTLYDAKYPSKILEIAIQSGILGASGRR
jgi:hypothetical protein